MRISTRATAGGFALALATTIGLTGCTGPVETTGPPVTLDAGKLRLAAFDSCDQALRELKASARRYVGPNGFAFGSHGDVAMGAEAGAADRAAAAAPGQAKSAPEYSGTNVHEAGVDEPDLVKTDGRRIVTVADGTLRVVDVASRRQTGTLQLGEHAHTQDPWGKHLLLYGDRALVIVQGGFQTYREYAPVAGTELLLIDLSGEPALLSSMRFEGEYVDARMVDGTAHLVMGSAPRVGFEGWDGRGSVARAVSRNLDVLDDATIDAWLPRFEVTTGGTVTRGKLDCTQLSRPTGYSGTSMLTVLSVGLESSGFSGRGAVSVVADGRTVYGTGEHLYVANDQSAVRPFALRGKPAPVQPRTEVYRFDISGSGAPRHAASGVVPGWLINQYAMSEYDGHLRIATTTGSPWGAGPEDRQPRTESAVYVLAQQGKLLNRVGEVGGLGKGERIYAVRFSGPVGYVVTFRQVDPLYVVDLRNPESPKVTGELKITGYSAYLHPAGDRLIGVGQEADAQGRTQGLQVSLFDVSDPTAPGRLAQYHLPGGHSQAEFDPHAFLYWPKSGLLAVPVMTYQDAERMAEPRGGILVLTVSQRGIAERGMLSHPVSDYGGQIQRSLIIDDTLWTVSAAGLAAHDAGSLTERAWISFR